MELINSDIITSNINHNNKQSITLPPPFPVTEPSCRVIEHERGHQRWHFSCQDDVPQNIGTAVEPGSNVSVWHYSL